MEHIVEIKEVTVNKETNMTDVGYVNAEVGNGEAHINDVAHVELPGQDTVDEAQTELQKMSDSDVVVETELGAMPVIDTKEEQHSAEAEIAQEFVKPEGHVVVNGEVVPDASLDTGVNSKNA